MRFRVPSKSMLRVAFTLGSVATVAGVMAIPIIPLLSLPAAWYGYGGNPQHTGISKYPVNAIGGVKWSVSLDEDISASSSGDSVLIHYASPCITSINPITGGGNTVVVAVHNNLGGAHDSWRVEGLSGSTGAVKWSYDTDFSAPVLMPADWTSVYPLSLVSTNSVVAAGGGGTVLFFPSADVTGAVSPTRFCFYTAVSNYNASPATYKNIKICTPITGDSKGNFFFGYTVTNSTGIPSDVLSRIGTGGVVKFNTAGRFTYRTAASIVTGMNRPAINCAPAISNDAKSVYFGLRSTSSNTGYLVKLNATDPGLNNPIPSLNTLALQASVRVLDPATGADARMIQESSSSPMVGPDGHVFMGVFGSNWRESHGWMLQFDKDLKQYDLSGHRFPIGAFGWDDTASIVPASAVPSYTGASSYLLLTKYNNYHVNTGDGFNHLAILDPSTSGSTDRQSALAVMKEINLIPGISCDLEYSTCTVSPNSAVNGATNASPIVLTTSAALGIVDGQKVEVHGVLGNTAANGTYYAKATGYTSTTFALYQDAGLTTPVSGNGAYTSGGLVCNPLIPVREWCINAAAVDPVNKCAIVNSEDGHAYKWDFVTNNLTQGTYLQPATGEAYTCTVVGQDGTSYAINNGILHALMPAPARP